MLLQHRRHFLKEVPVAVVESEGNCTLPYRPDPPNPLHHVSEGHGPVPLVVEKTHLGFELIGSQSPVAQPLARMDADPVIHEDFHALTLKHRPSPPSELAPCGG